MNYRLHRVADARLVGMTNAYPQPERFPVGHPEREREQQRKNAFVAAFAAGLLPRHPPTSRACARNLHQERPAMSHSETLQHMLDNDLDLRDSEASAIRSAIFVLSQARQRRERIATAAMQGLLASGVVYEETVAKKAVVQADALLAELEKPLRPFGWYRPRQGEDADQEPEFRTSQPPHGHGWLPVPAAAPAEWSR
ncbi:hypothetical protein J5226_12845 [Lysobacter sp. K5869]|uniref:hypothetical protein n=1 Tax=Lysobacter sp. K5869 TaxID=2820808 RepID=UPI001C063A2F|nr:hypothetical protein [Lysobacter sp. K5869]QWP79212.1 hypothetical protein J5226_12845 [Lysobacter sp. K5869]